MKDENKSIEQLEAEINKLAEERQELFKRISPLEDKLRSKYKRIEKLTEIRDTKRIEEQTLSWPDLLNTTGNDGLTIYREAGRRLNEIGLSHSGMIVKSQQRCIQISVAFDASDAQISKKADGIRTILPYLKTFQHEVYEGEGIYFDVMEHTLSEFGVYGAWHVPATGQWSLVKTVYGSQRVVSTHDSLEDFLLMLKVSHPYPADERVNYDDDDYGY